MPSPNRREFIGGAFALLGAAGIRLPMWAQAAGMSSSSGPLLLGVDYYPDQTPENLWDEDARMMAEVGFTNVRIAEFAWGLMEPAEGKFDFAWLRRAVETLQKYKIAVILGTPSAAPPPWLTVRYPDIVEVNAQGERLHPGGRRFTCPTNQVYRRLSLTIATEMARAFAETPGVIGWQIDNELTLGPTQRCYCNFCQAGFQTWVRAKYGSLDNLNRKWGTVFWSQTYSDFAQIPVPLPSGGDPNPGLALDYDRYQSFANVSFQQEQLDMLRKMCPRHFVTTNNVGPPLDTIDLRSLYEKLDFVAFDNYPIFFEMMLRQEKQNVTPETIPTGIALGHDFARGAKGGKPFMIMEEQSGKAGQKTFSPQPEKGQVRLWTYQAVAHGAMGLNYFRWDTATFGAEEYWHGILNHDRSKSPAYPEIKQATKELKALGSDVLYSQYAAETALVFDYDCGWALKIQPGHFALTYMAQVNAWYGAINASHSGIDVIAPEVDLSTYKIVFAPVLYVLSEAQAARIRSFVQGGGVFVTNFRLGVKDESSQIVRTPLPGLLRDVMGVTVEDYVPLYSPGQGVKFSSMLAGADATCGIWADILQPAGAEVLGSYTSGSHAGKAAVTMNSFGKGKAVYIGGDLDAGSLARVLRSLSQSAGVKQPFDVPAGVEMTVRKSGDKEWIFLLNHAAVAQTVSIPKPMTDLLTKEAHSGTIELSGYGVRVLV
ncbi:MAG: beta-galactosidase [Terriglobales bacterium]